MRVTLRLPPGSGITDGAEVGMRRAVEHLLGVSRSLAPIDEGTMIRSSEATVTSDGSVVTGTVTYSTPYAIRQHEELAYRHAPGRQAKYLEGPMHTEAQVMGDLIAAAIRGQT
jgi:hypothetical protein